MGDYIEESIILISLEVTPEITEFIDASPKDSTLILSEVTSMITELTDVSPKNNALIFLEITQVITESVVIFSEELLNKLPPTRHI